MITELLQEMDQVETLPATQRAAERLVLFRRVETALRAYVMREERLFDSVRKLRPSMRELSIRLIALEKTAPTTVPDPELLREYRGALRNAVVAAAELERAIRHLEESP